MLKTLIAPAAVALCIVAFPAASEVTRGHYVEVPPPAPPAEVIPAAREGFIWAPGYYTWHGDSYVWMSGHWEPARVGYRYVAPRWIQEGSRWRYTDEQWIRDEDHAYGRDSLPENRER